MSHAFQRLAKASRQRSSALKKLGWAKRIARIEEAVFEANAYLVAQIHQRRGPGDTLSRSETDFLEMAEEYRKHLTSVLEVTASSTR